MIWHCQTYVHVKQTIKGDVYSKICVYINLFIRFVGQAILNNGCISNELMLSGLRNVGSIMTLQYTQPFWPMNNHSAIKQ